MPSPPRLDTLEVADRNELESLLIEFDQAWESDSLDSYCGQIAKRGLERYRAVALSELVKIELQRSWAAGKGRLLDEYLRRFPELGTLESVDANLVACEFAARSSVESELDLADYRSRFPIQFAQLVQIAADVADSSPSVHPAGREQQVQASIDTSQIDKLRETTIGNEKKRPVRLPVEFGRYRILKELGSGAMGKVYLAHDSTLDRQVALKTPSFSGSSDEDLATRFYREARAAAKLQHRNICPVYDVGEINGRKFISMAFVKGRCMSDFIKPGKLPPPKTSAILIHRLALALAEAHRHNVIHRDLKPANIMIDQEREPVVMDFGLARQTDVESRLTQSGMAVGTPAYMSPEQIRGNLDEVGNTADIYALGVILYELLTGQLPFRGKIAQVVYKIVNEEPVAPSTLGNAIDPDLESICAKMMAKKVGERYQSMTDVASDLKDYVKGRSVQGTKPSAESIEPQRPSDRPTNSQTDLEQVSETGALNAFFAAQSVDPMDTAIEPRALKNPAPSVQPRVQSSRVKRGNRNKLFAAGLGGLLLLAGVIIFFPDGTKVEIEDGVTAKLETNPDGTLKSITTGNHPTNQDEELNRPITAPVNTSSPKVAQNKHGSMTPKEVLTSDEWEWSEPVFLGSFFNESRNLDTELGSEFTTWYAPLYGNDIQRHPGIDKGSGESDIWQFSREPNDATWTQSKNLGSVVNSAENDVDPSLTADGLKMVFSSDRPVGDPWKSDLWITSRKSIGADWSRPVNLGQRANGAGWDGHPYIAENGRAIYFSSNRKNAGHGGSDLYVTRSDTKGGWASAENLGRTVNSSAGEMGPTVSSDGLVLVFFSLDRPGGHGNHDLWMTHRDSITDPWSTPVNLGPPVNTAGWETPRGISSDGKLLLFDRIPLTGKRTEGHGTWVARRVPKQDSASVVPTPALTPTAGGNGVGTLQ